MKNSDLVTKKRLLLVATTAGTFEAILKEQPEFLAQYFEVAIACSVDQHFAQLKERSPFKVYYVPMMRGISPIYDLKSILAMSGVIKKFKPDIVHSYTPKAGLIAMLSGFFCCVKVRIHTFTGLIFPTSIGVKKKILIFVDKIVSSLATYVVPESEGVKKDLISHGVCNSDIAVIGCGNIAGVDVDYFSPVSCGLLPDEPNFAIDLNRRGSFVYCFVGRLNRDKGIRELVQAFAALSFDASLVFVGGVDETAPPDSLTLAEINSNPKIFSVGFQTDIRPFFCAADILVLPSYREGFPNVVLQAMAMQLPVISTNVSGANEVVIPNRTGWIVPVKDVESLRLAMVDARETPAVILECMGIEARKFVVERFERGFYLENLLSFYRAVMN